jgi:hypothetical protein
VVEHPQHRQHTQREWNARHEAVARQSTQRAVRFVRRSVNDNIQVCNWSDMAVQDDGDATNHDISNIITF